LTENRVSQQTFNDFRSARITRRRLLGSAAKLAAATFASSLLPPNVRRALTEEVPQSGSLRLNQARGSADAGEPFF
jgi:hypothetical protein